VSETAILWIFGTVIALQTTIVGAIAAALWVHIGHCKDAASSMARIETNVERLTEDIGTHETGIRGTVHKTANRMTEHESRLIALERRRGTER
jgi:hypothetical protein